jgi:hypothetical protein
MASDRVIIVRIAGCGTSSGGQYEFTSRAGLSYLGNEVAGVVSDLGPQFTSEIGMFAAMGSDPTTSITMLTTATTLRAFNSRAQLPVRNAAEELVTMASYSQPTPSMTFDVSDGTALSIGNEYRVHMTTFFVTNITGNTIDALRSRGCGISPIPMTKVGESVIGATIYDARDDSPQGGVDSMPIEISTAELTAANRAAEQVIFRGIVTRASNDTSARNGNLIRIEAGSMLGYAKNAQFRPPIAQSCGIDMQRRQINIGGRFAYSMTALYAYAKFDPRTDGFVTDGFTSSATAYDALQLRQEGSGGVLMRWHNSQIVPDVTPTSETLNAASVPGVPGPYGAESGGWSFITTFVDAHYGNATLPSTGISQFENLNGQGYRFDWANGTQTETTVAVENCFLSDSPVNLIMDLLFGSHFGSFSDGYRSAQQAAWLPYDGINTVLGDLIDYPSLLAVLEGREDVFPRVQFVPWYAEEPYTPASYYVLPYDMSGDKTIGAILERIMQKLGACMLYDRGVLRFVSWASASGFPVSVIDTHLAAPAARLAFDNGACLQSVNCDVILRIGAIDQMMAKTGEIVEQPIPVVNVLLGPQQRGKQMKVGTFRQLAHGMAQAVGLTSFAFANAAIVRFSNPAAMLGVSLRNAARDLDIGQSVIVSSAFVPNAFGTMGLENAAGIVIKAARSWATPTTDYSIMLTGYLNAVSGIALISPAGRVTLVAGSDLKIADNDFTRTFPVSSSSPINDADAFEQVREISGVNPLPVQLLDEYGTLIATDTCTVDVNNSLLQFGAAPFGGAASIGDIVVLDAAANYFPATMWDAFLADNIGEVAGSQSNAREWSS